MLENPLIIKQRLALTDKLIDHIVYRLYGLTEEEIRVVEGSEFVCYLKTVVWGFTKTSNNFLAMY